MLKGFKWILPILVLALPVLAMEEVERQEVKPKDKPTLVKLDPDALVIGEAQTVGFSTKSGAYFTKLLRRKNKKKIQIRWLNEKGEVPHLTIPPIGTYFVTDDQGKKKEVDNYSEVLDFINLLDIDKNKGIQLVVTFAETARTSIKEFWSALAEKMPKKLAIFNVVDRRKKFDLSFYDGMLGACVDCPDVSIKLSSGGTKDIASLYDLFTNPVGFVAAIEGDPCPRVVITESAPADFNGRTLFEGKFHNPKNDITDFWPALAKRDWSNVHELLLRDINRNLIPESYQALSGIFNNIKRIGLGGLRSTPADIMQLLSYWGLKGTRFNFYYVTFRDHLSNTNKEKRQPIQFGVNIENMLQLPKITPENMDAIESAVAIVNPAELNGVVMPFVKLGDKPSELVKRLISYFEWGWEDICELAVTVKDLAFNKEFLPINQTVFPNVNRLRLAGCYVDMDVMMEYISKFEQLVLFESLSDRSCGDPEKLLTAYSLLFEKHNTLRWLTTCEDLTHPFVLQHSMFKSLVESAKKCKDFKVLEVASFDIYDESKQLLEAWPNLQHIKVNNLVAVIDRLNESLPKDDTGAHVEKHLENAKNLRSLAYTKIIFYEHDKFDGEQCPENRMVKNQLKAKKMEDMVRQALAKRQAANKSGKLEVLNYEQFNAKKPSLRVELLGIGGLKKTRKVEVVKSSFKGVSNPKDHLKNSEG